MPATTTRQQNKSTATGLHFDNPEAQTMYNLVCKWSREETPKKFTVSSIGGNENRLGINFGGAFSVQLVAGWLPPRSVERTLIFKQTRRGRLYAVPADPAQLPVNAAGICQEYRPDSECFFRGVLHYGNGDYYFKDQLTGVVLRPVSQQFWKDLEDAYKDQGRLSGRLFELRGWPATTCWIVMPAQGPEKVFATTALSPTQRNLLREKMLKDEQAHGMIRVQLPNGDEQAVFACTLLGIGMDESLTKELVNTQYRLKTTIIDTHDDGTQVMVLEGKRCVKFSEVGFIPDNECEATLIEARKLLMKLVKQNIGRMNDLLNGHEGEFNPNLPDEEDHRPPVQLPPLVEPPKQTEPTRKAASKPVTPPVALNTATYRCKHCGADNILSPKMTEEARKRVRCGNSKCMELLFSETPVQPTPVPHDLAATNPAAAAALTAAAERLAANGPKLELRCPDCNQFVHDVPGNFRGDLDCSMHQLAGKGKKSKRLVFKPIAPSPTPDTPDTPADTPAPAPPPQLSSYVRCDECGKRHMRPVGFLGDRLSNCPPKKGKAASAAE